MKNNIVILQILIILLLVFERFFLNNDATFTRFMEFQVVATWSIAMYYSYKNYGLFSLYSLCLIGIFMFAIGGIFHFLVSGNDIRYLERGFGEFVFTHRTIQEALWAYSVFIFLSYLSYKIFRSKNYNIILKNKLGRNETYFYIGRTLMFLFLVFQVYKGYLFYTSFSLNRVDIFLMGNMSNPVPTWLRFVAYIFEIGYYFILASIPDQREFKKYSFLYFVVFIPEIMLGNRGMLGAFLLFYLWYYYTFYGKMAIKTRTAVIGGFAMLIIFQLMEFMRDGANVNLASVSFTKFLVGQSVSFYILPLYIDYVDSMQYYLYPFFLYGILSGFTGYTGQSIEVLQHNCGVGHQLMYTVNPSYYLTGASFGSSSITEIYDAGILGFILLSIFFSIMLLFFERKIQTNRFFCFGSLVFISSFILSSRGSFFPSLYGIVKLFIFYNLFLLISGRNILKK